MMTQALILELAHNYAVLESNRIQKVINEQKKRFSEPDSLTAKKDEHWTNIVLELEQLMFEESQK